MGEVTKQANCGIEVNTLLAMYKGLIILNTEVERE